MNGWIISTIVLTVIVIVELVCFITHKVKKHRKQRKYKLYLDKDMRRKVNEMWAAYIDDLTDPDYEY